MPSWREMAARVMAESVPAPEHLDSPDNAEMAAGLVQLEARRLPRGCNEDEWGRIVMDAKRLAKEGWAERALALGWSMTDLFGIGPNDDWEFSGLAVWLQGRALVLLDADSAISKDGTARFCFKRGGLGNGKQPSVDPVLLWHFRRG
jgi:hypothetical protein